jgi:hypothetical protein
MKPLVQALASILGSIVMSLTATVVLRRLALTAQERPRDASARRPPGPVVVVILPIVGNQWFIGTPGPSGGKRSWMGRLTAGRKRARSRTRR